MSEHAKEIEVVIDDQGTARFIYDDDLAGLIPAGYTCPIQRASHVEPTADGRWFADMRPALELMSTDQRTAWRLSPEATLALGPFATRAEALAAEVAWLKEWAGV